MNNEPVAYVDKIWIERPDLVMSQQLDIGRLFMRSGKEIKNYIPLYTHPAELTDEEIIEIGLLTTDPRFSHIESPLLLEFARAILKKAQK